MTQEEEYVEENKNSEIFTFSDFITNIVF